MKLLAVVLFFNKDFMSYYTTIGKTIYWPNLDSFGSDAYEDVSILFHEGQHRADEKSFGPIYHLGYLFPQLLALLGITLPLLAIWLDLFWLVSLVMLAAAAPLPAPFRTAFELRGYSCNVHLAFWERGKVSDKHLEHIASQFTGHWYYFMCPSESYIDARLRRMRRETQCGKMTRWQRKVCDFLGGPVP